MYQKSRTFYTLNKIHSVKTYSLSNSRLDIGHGKFRWRANYLHCYFLKKNNLDANQMIKQTRKIILLSYAILKGPNYAIVIKSRSDWKYAFVEADNFFCRPAGVNPFLKRWNIDRENNF